MVLDPNLIRDLLLWLETHDNGGTFDSRGIAGSDGFLHRSNSEIVYHLERMGEAGLVNLGQKAIGWGESRAVVIRGLHINGHQFLATMRNDRVWKKTLEGLAKLGVGVVIPVLSGLAMKAAKEFVGLD